MFFVYLDNILSIMTKYSVNKVPSDILILIAQNVVALRKEQGVEFKENPVFNCWP